MNLRDLLIARIQHSGPITIAEYMTECLLHPDFGYYTTRDPLGSSGDFITSPEISQMFGELLGLSLAQSWTDQGRPSPFVLAELGPGRGTLMADLLRATRSVPGFHAAATIMLLEASPALQKRQSDALNDADVTWVAQVDELPDAPVFLIANEFFDALPIRQFVRDGQSWRERQVGLDESGLCFGLGAPVEQSALASRLADTRAGDLIEICDSALSIMRTVSTRISTYGGAALIIDYGDWRSLGDTLQAVQAHGPADPLADPGHADLTAHVDFEALAIAARTAGCRHSRMTPQGHFLERLGITERANALSRNLESGPLDSLIAAHRRLTHPDEMGNLFKVLGLCPHRAHLPPGLDP
ncbi:MAG: SAM-dependent methyltransferase [Pseudomonadota bacterium]